MLKEKKQLDFYELLIKNNLPIPIAILHAFVDLLIHHDTAT